jgi:Transcriptional regulators
MTITPEIRPPARRQGALGSAGFLLARLGIGYKARVIEGMDQAGYELYDYGVLALLAEGVRETQSTIAQSLDVDPSRMVALLDSLEQRGLIERHATRRTGGATWSASRPPASASSPRARRRQEARGRVLRAARRGEAGAALRDPR